MDWTSWFKSDASADSLSAEIVRDRLATLRNEKASALAERARELASRRISDSELNEAVAVSCAYIEVGYGFQFTEQRLVAVIALCQNKIVEASWTAVARNWLLLPALFFKVVKGPLDSRRKHWGAGTRAFPVYVTKLTDSDIQMFCRQCGPALTALGLRYRPLYAATSDVFDSWIAHRHEVAITTLERLISDALDDLNPMTEKGWSLIAPPPAVNGIIDAVDSYITGPRSHRLQAYGLGACDWSVFSKDVLPGKFQEQTGKGGRFQTVAAPPRDPVPGDGPSPKHSYWLHPINLLLMWRSKSGFCLSRELIPEVWAESLGLVSASQTPSLPPPALFVGSDSREARDKLIAGVRASLEKARRPVVVCETPQQAIHWQQILEQCGMRTVLVLPTQTVAEFLQHQVALHIGAEPSPVFVCAADSARQLSFDREEAAQACDWIFELRTSKRERLAKDVKKAAPIIFDWFAPGLDRRSGYGQEVARRTRQTEAETLTVTATLDEITSWANFLRSTPVAEEIASSFESDPKMAMKYYAWKLETVLKTPGRAHAEIALAADRVTLLVFYARFALTWGSLSALRGLAPEARIELKPYRDLTDEAKAEATSLRKQIHTIDESLTALRELLDREKRTPASAEELDWQYAKAMEERAAHEILQLISHTWPELWNSISQQIDTAQRAWEHGNGVDLAALNSAIASQWTTWTIRVLEAFSRSNPFFTVKVPPPATNDQSPLALLKKFFNR